MIIASVCLLSLAHQRKSKQIKKSHTIRSLQKPLDQPEKAEPKMKKKFNLEAWEKEASNTISLKKKKKKGKAEKYYTNERTN